MPKVKIGFLIYNSLFLLLFCVLGGVVWLESPGISYKKVNSVDGFS